MNSTDLVAILGNLSQALAPLQHLITGFAYILGLLFFVSALDKFKKKADMGSSGGQESIYVPVMYMLMGAFLLYLPSAMSTLANTAFGAGNVLTYSPQTNKADVYKSIGLLVRFGGVIWFIRGCVLVAHSSEPGEKHGPKGLLFLIAGVFAMNFDNTVAGINWGFSYLINYTMSLKASQGF